jgi:hypothetical protein
MYPHGPPHDKAFYVGLENGLGIGEGVPYPVRCRGGPYRGQGVGTVWPSKESLWSPWAAGLHPSQARNHPSATYVASWSAYLAAQGMIMHIIRLCVQVREAGTWGDIDQDLGPLSARC